MLEDAPSTELGAQRRRSTRIVQAVPLTVTGVDALGQPFKERTSTLDINYHGYRYRSKHYVLKDKWVTLEIPHPETEHEPLKVRARVAWIQRPRTVREQFQVGGELEVPGNVWGIAFPPEDWLLFAEAAAAAIPAPPEQEEAPSEAFELLPLPLPENRVRVLPRPGPSEVPAALASEIESELAAAKQQLGRAVREAVTETRQLFRQLTAELETAAEKAVEAAAASHAGPAIRRAVEQIDEARQSSLNSLREQWSSEFERGLGDASLELVARLAELRKELDDAAEVARRRLQRHAEDLLVHTGQMEQAAQKLNEGITQATEQALADWRAKLAFDLNAARSEWHGAIESSLSTAAQRFADRLAQISQTTATDTEQEITARLGASRQSLAETVAEAERALDGFHTALQNDLLRAKTSLLEIEQAASRAAELSAQLEATSQRTADELNRRFEAILAAQSGELSQRAESLIAGMVARLQPALEETSNKSVTDFLSQVERKLEPLLKGSREVIEKLAASQQAAEEALRAQRERLQQAVEPQMRKAAARMQDTAAELQKDFEQSGRATLAKWLEELESKATEVKHTTSEDLYKTSEWYQKKAQTSIQSALEKALEQAANVLREKAGEISRLLASELDHYSRSYFEQTQELLDETGKEMVERVRVQLNQAAETTAATFHDEIHNFAEQKLQRFAEASSTAFGEAAANLQARAEQVCSQVEAHAEQTFTKLKRDMSDWFEQGLAHARRDLETSLLPTLEAWRAEDEAQQREWVEKMARLSTEFVERYKQRLENVSNSCIVASVATLNQHSQSVLDSLTKAAEQRFRETCAEVFARMVETMHQQPPPAPTGVQPRTTPPKKK